VHHFHADTGTDWRTSLVGDIHLAASAEAETTLMLRGFTTLPDIGGPSPANR
jgi:hypothetical protein